LLEFQQEAVITMQLNYNQENKTRKVGNTALPGAC